MYLMTYRHLSHTDSSKFIVSCECEHYVRISEQRCSDVGDLPVLTCGNCVLKTEVTKWPLKL